MSQAFQCDGCNTLVAGTAPAARASIAVRLHGARSEYSYEFCNVCAEKLGDKSASVGEAARRIVTPPTVDVPALLAQLADASEAVGYGRHAHPGNIVQVLLEKARAR